MTEVENIFHKRLIYAAYSNQIVSEPLPLLKQLPL